MWLASTAVPVAGTLDLWHGVGLFVLGLLLGFGLVSWTSKSARKALVERLHWTEQRARHNEAAAEDNERLRIELADLKARHEAGIEKIAWIHTADEQLRLTFQDLADQLLRRGSKDLSDRARDELSFLVGPLQQQLTGLDQQIRALESERQGAYAGLQKELDLLRTSQEDLRRSAGALRETLSAPGRRGRWGEIQLRRLIELAGLVDRVDFTEQPTLSDGRRPDLIVHLPGERSLPIDAKTPMSSFLAAQEEQDPKRRQKLLDDHLKALQQRVAELASKAYWRNIPGAPDFVIMFLPNEGMLAAAFERRPNLLETCMAQKVLPATPITLLALLRSVAWGWRQHAVTEDAARIAEAGRELHDRLLKFNDHLIQVGRGLDGAVRGFNQAVGSFERRLLPSVRRLEETAATDQTIEPAATLDQAPRRPSDE